MKLKSKGIRDCVKKKKKNSCVNSERNCDFLQMQEWENFTESKSISNPKKEVEIFYCVQFLHSKICCK